MARIISNETYISECKAIHGERYDYRQTVYRKAQLKVDIICPTHGLFKQLAYCHKQGQGCPKCSHTADVSCEEFCNRSYSRYSGKYLVDRQSYTGIKNAVRITCSDHGPFEIKVAEIHLRKNGCCPECVMNVRMKNLRPGSVSRAETKWLEELSVPLRQVRLIIDGEAIIVDGYNPDTNTVYEYYGSYWHGNPRKYSAEDYNVVLNTAFGSLYEETMRREKLIKMSYNLISHWGR